MGHMGNNGKIAIAAFFAALALLALAGITLHETVFLWFLGASAAAYAACVSEVVIRRRHRTLAASGVGSTLFIAFGIAFLRQWGLAFNADPAALSARVDSEHPDLYFYLAAASGAATLLLLVAGTVLPGRGRRPRAAGAVKRRRPPSGARGPAPRGAAPRSSASRASAPRAGARPAKAGPASTGSARTTRAKAQPAGAQSARVPVRATSSGPKRAASSGGATGSTAPPAPAARPAARPSPRR